MHIRCLSFFSNSIGDCVRFLAVRFLAIRSLSVLRLAVSLLALSTGCVAGPEPLAGDWGLEPGQWSVVVLPDTQGYSRSNPSLFQAQTGWIVQRRDDLDIRFVLHAGDIVDGNSETQWRNARAALRILDDGVPYLLVPGNHDYGPGGSGKDRETLLDRFFPVEAFEARPGFGGVFETGRIDNSYHLFETPAGPWLVLGLEFGPRDAVVRWADEILSAHVGVPAILLTHAYLYSDDTRYEHQDRPDQSGSPYAYGMAILEGSVNDGEDLWRKLARRHGDLALVLCGHAMNDGAGRLSSLQDSGTLLHQLLANYQMLDNDGNGFLRIMVFDEDNAYLRVLTYSPYLDEWLRDPDNEFVLDLAAALPD